jgi:5-methylcytosine-specific restriction endonuclease McrA
VAAVTPWVFEKESPGPRLGGILSGPDATRPPPKRRQIPIATQVQVYFRGGWLCSLCDRPTIFPLAMKFAAGVVLDRKYELPIAYYDPKWRRDKSPLLDHLGCVIDHVEAHSRGGAHDAENFAVACNKCNVRKSAGEKMGYLRENPPRRVKGKYGEPKHWDGLSSLFVVLARENPERLRELEAYIRGATSPG